MWNKRVKNNPNGMATVAKSDHFHALERGIRTESSGTRTEFCLINKSRVGLGEPYRSFQFIIL